MKQLLNRFATWLLIHTMQRDEDWDATVQAEDDAEFYQLHLTPPDDAIQHEDSLDCCCGPVIRPAEVIYHPSLDGREHEGNPPLENPHGLLDEFDGLE